MGRQESPQLIERKTQVDTDAQETSRASKYYTFVSAITLLLKYAWETCLFKHVLIFCAVWYTDVVFLYVMLCFIAWTYLLETWNSGPSFPICTLTLSTHILKN